MFVSKMFVLRVVFVSRYVQQEAPFVTKKSSTVKFEK